MVHWTRVFLDRPPQSQLDAACGSCRCYGQLSVAQAYVRFVRDPRGMLTPALQIGAVHHVHAVATHIQGT